jgi:hypothetical protein
MLGLFALPGSSSTSNLETKMRPVDTTKRRSEILERRAQQCAVCSVCANFNSTRVGIFSKHLIQSFLTANIPLYESALTASLPRSLEALLIQSLGTLHSTSLHWPPHCHVHFYSNLHTDPIFVSLVSLITKGSSERLHVRMLCLTSCMLCLTSCMLCLTSCSQWGVGGWPSTWRGTCRR